ncbi:DUF7882 family protein [Leifsonia sp. 2MCAF36]|uniref:DUF7882 family protein n=1 Tax=Leifsonia sp. 2MCAF36 TaxID=3232988 RepID=UPI003F986BA8
MGTLRYAGESYELEDRALFHLQIAISTKLRRRENFFLSWMGPRDMGSGRHTIWVDNGIPLHICFTGSRQPHLNRVWMEQLLDSAADGAGMILGEEPDSLPERAVASGVVTSQPGAPGAGH